MLKEVINILTKTNKQTRRQKNKENENNLLLNIVGGGNDAASTHFRGVYQTSCVIRSEAGKELICV